MFIELTDYVDSTPIIVNVSDIIVVTQEDNHTEVLLNLHKEIRTVKVKETVKHLSSLLGCNRKNLAE